MGAAYLQGIRMVGGENNFVRSLLSGEDRLMKGGSAASLLTIHIGVMSADPDWLTIQCDWGSSDGSSSWISAWLNLFFIFPEGVWQPLIPFSPFRTHACSPKRSVWRGLEKKLLAGQVSNVHGQP